ncbi:MAG: heme-binding protein [Anaerolineae bacterium]|nr:heme-binding protein [Anaerolineae bacterium]
MHQITTLSHADAMRIITTIQTELDQRGQGAAIAVVDPHGELLAFLRTDGCKLPSITIALNKAFTAARERVPSYDVGLVDERSRPADLGRTHRRTRS